MIEDTETIDEFLARHSTDVEEAVRKVAAAEIMPRFRRLAAHEIEQKAGPHDLVTDADRNAELYLTQVLGALLPGSVVVGEEAVHANPATYEAIQGDAPVWIVDPVDGTRQFVHGNDGFCTLVALVRHGVLHASWTYAPARDQLATAVRGGGAFLDGERLFAGPPEPGRDLRVATSHPDYTTEDQKRAARAADGRGRTACVRVGRARVSRHSPGRVGRDGVLLGGGLGPRGRTAAGRGGGRRPPHAHGRAVPCHGRQLTAVHGGPGRGDGPPGGGTAGGHRSPDGLTG